MSKKTVVQIESEAKAIDSIRDAILGEGQPVAPGWVYRVREQLAELDEARAELAAFTKLLCDPHGRETLAQAVERLRAYQDGFASGEQDFSEDTNPYDEGSEPHKAWVRAFKAAQSVTAMDFLQAEVDRLQSLLPAVAKAARNAAKMLLLTIPRRSHVFGHDKECLFIGDVEEAIDGMDIDALIEQTQ